MYFSKKSTLFVGNFLHFAWLPARLFFPLLELSHIFFDSTHNSNKGKPMKES